MEKIKKNILAITLFQGWMRALKVDKSGNEKSWSAKNKAFNLEEIREAVKAAVRATGASGDYVSIALDHDMLRRKTVDIPPMSSRDLHAYVARKVDQIKEFEEEAAFSYVKESVKGKMFVSINYLPLSFVIDLKQICTDAGLFLMQITPFLRVIALQFRELTIGENDAAIIVAKMFDKISLFIGKSKGSVFSHRGLKADMTKEEDIERIVKEIKRSVLYNKQQYGERVVLVKLSEDFSEAVFHYLEEDLDIPVVWLPKTQRFFWNRELLHIPFKDGSNMLFKKFRYEITIRKFTRIAVIMVLATWIIPILSSVVIEYLLYKEREVVAINNLQTVKLLKSKELLLGRKAELEQLNLNAKILKEERMKPVPGWFLGYLCNEVPEGLILTKTQVLHNEHERTWEIIIEGYSAKGNKTMTKKLRALCNNLRNGPFHMRINKDWYEDWLTQLKKGVTSDRGMSRFSISGFIQGT